MDHTPDSPLPSESPYASRGPGGPGGPAPLPWYRLLVRVVLVVVPGQLVGTLVAVLLLSPVDLTAHPGATALLWVVPGLLTGVGLALLVRARPTLPWGLVLVAAAVSLLVNLLLVRLGQARAGFSASLLDPRLLRGVLGYVALQTVVAVALWLLLRRRPRR